MPNINRDIHGNTHFSAMCNRDFVCLLDFVCLVARYDQGISKAIHILLQCVIEILYVSETLYV